MTDEHVNYGKGTAGRRKRNTGQTIAWVRAHVTYEGDECLFWPFAKDKLRGHGMVGWTELDGTKHSKKVHRLMCELAHGQPPAPYFEAAHECGNGHLGCVNPKHLSWKTRSENQLDRRKHGTANQSKGARTRLTVEQIAEIRAMKGKITPARLAPLYGLKRGGIEYWQRDNHEPAPPGMSREAIRRRANRA